MCDDELPVAAALADAGCDTACSTNNETCGFDGYVVIYESIRTVEVRVLHLLSIL